MPDQELSIPFDDRRPIPEILAEFYGFALAYHDTDDGRFYAVLDWIRGVTKTPDGEMISDTSKYWHDIKRRLRPGRIDLASQCKKLPYKATDGKTYERDFANSETLINIMQYMDKRTGIVSEVLTGMRYDKQALAHVYLGSVCKL